MAAHDSAQGGQHTAAHVAQVGGLQDVSITRLLGPRTPAFGGFGGHGFVVGQVTNNKDANTHVRRRYRKRWEVTGL